MSESVGVTVLRSMKRSLEVFCPDGPSDARDAEEERPMWQKLRLASKIHDEYSLASQPSAAPPQPPQPPQSPQQRPQPSPAPSTALVLAPPPQNAGALVRTTLSELNKPQWHAPWKLYRVVAGHLGWVRCVSVDPANMWFATGSADRTIKIWDVASGALKLTLTGHISTVRGLAVSRRAPYLFSCGEDKMVKCWDLEYNRVIRHYHGHLSGVYCLALHPTLDVLVTGGRDAAVRVWDIRTQANVHTLSGHTNAVMSVATQSVDPQLVSGAMDNNVRLWDLAAGKSLVTLTHHKKGIRGIAIHPSEFAMVTGAADSIKKWRFPNGDFLCNFDGHRAIVNSIAVNADGVVVSGGDNGSMHLWDWKTGYCFQQVQSIPQPGSLESEAGIYALGFDQTGTRLITCEADKSIKMWKPDEEASPETHPVANWRRAQDRQRF